MLLRISSAVVHPAMLYSDTADSTVFQAPQAFLKALLENFPGETTRKQSQHNEGSRAVQHMAFCTCAGRATCTSFVNWSEKAWPQTRWPSSCTVVFPLTHQVITTPPLPVQFQACIVDLLQKQLHFQSYRLHALGQRIQHKVKHRRHQWHYKVVGVWGFFLLV